MMASRWTSRLESDPSHCLRCRSPLAVGERVTWSAAGRAAGLICEACSVPRCTEFAPPAPPASPAPTTTPTTPTTPTAAPTIAAAIEAAIAAAVAAVPAAPAPTIDPDAILAAARDAAREAVADALAPTRIVVARPPDVTTPTMVTHRLFPTLLKHAAARRHTYIWGPTQSGKSKAAAQVADALGLPYYELALSKTTSRSEIFGYQTTVGEYVPSLLYRAYTTGGVYCLDEFDNGRPDLQVSTNNLIANGRGAFPCGMVERHRDFVLIATGNTAGRGADPSYPERLAFDASTLARFVSLSWPYDESLERTLALAEWSQAGPWVDWIVKIRAFATKTMPRLIVAPTASTRGAAMLRDGFGVDETAESLLWRGLDDASKGKVLASHPLPKVAS
jgi:hypothetical protein